MIEQMPVRSKSLAAQLVDLLVKRIANGTYPPETQFPPEKQLAADFNVSRATIRSAVAVLAARRLVVKRRGVGTFVAARNQLKNPLHVAENFDTMIRKNGSEPSIAYLDVELVLPERHIVAALEIGETDEVLRSYKVFSADSQPVIYCCNLIPVAILGVELSQRAMKTPSITEPLFDFLETKCAAPTHYQTTKLRVALAGDCEFPDFPFEDHIPVLVLEDTGYDATDRPIWYSQSYFPDNMMSLEIMRLRQRK
ncbi:MAG: GntR family transcriptional regulator [Candidatus Promineifilaceae bacterium]